MVIIKKQSDGIIRNLKFCYAWWFPPVFSALMRMMEEDQDFEASLGYIVMANPRYTEILS